MRLIYITGCAFALSGCATLSFAPPQVRMDHSIEAKNNETFFNAVCTPDQNPPTVRQIRPGVTGALRLIDNYILTYRCQRDRAAEGRQFFEVPAFLGMAGAATAAALGAGPIVAIAAGAASATLDHTKQYYAPQQKAKVFADGLQAMLCIQGEAVGVDPYVLKIVSNAQDAAAGNKPPSDADLAQTITNSTGGKGNGNDLASTADKEAAAQAFVSVSYGRQYYETVRMALFSVEQAVAERLSTTGGAFNAEGLVAEIEKLNKKAKDEATAAMPGVPASDSGGVAGSSDTGDNAKTLDVKAAEAAAAAKEAAEQKAGAQVMDMVNNQSNIERGSKPETPEVKLANDLQKQKIGRTIIKLDLLHTKLQQCVLLAKL